MNGINKHTGERLSGIAHLRQSIADILSTRIGTRVLNREYGSRLPSLIDAPVNADTSLEFYAATAEALHRWEPRFTLKNVRIASLTDGVLALNLTGEYLPDGKQITLEGVEVT
ncbi:GPW/gp25 family protein [Halodesulfovibrio spirochaetisodalis]|uniref:Phage baseplate protein n=1 Tax=Halodesulfovibrio spirochaetisodalis TaxID=1560234 RepID=A0A1B7XDJ1_9BACT|nr:GPW/gp25 family protein [Halodesulfovibrio spirochaetisodalis]OBQ52115.1 phage baseplate protein [Halodesulfovibrio spirochaetisodalis]